MQCPQHGVEFKLVPAGVSKATGNSYDAFYACPERGCKERPPRGWNAVRQEVAQKVAPEKAQMTKEDWEAKEARTNRNILLQVAFKAAIEYGLKDSQQIFAKTLEYHQWLISRTEGQPPSKPIPLGAEKYISPADLVEQANQQISYAQAEDVNVEDIPF